MDRRSFLALIASAPIAALAPWPQFLPAPRVAFHRDAFTLTMAPLSEDATAAFAAIIRHHGAILNSLIADVYAPRHLTRAEMQFDPARLPN